MKLTYLAVGFAVSLACAGAAVADQSQTQGSNSTTTTVTTPKKVKRHHYAPLTESQMIAQQGAQIKQLQTQVAQLKNQMGTSGVSTDGSASISRASDAISSGYMTIKTDSQSPFVLLPSNSFSTALLQDKKAYLNTSQALVLGGYIEADPQIWNGGQTMVANPSDYKNGSGFYLTTAKLDAMANVTSNVTGFVEVDGNFTASPSNPSISKAFIMLGNLNQSPFFAIAGKTNLSYGAFGGGGPWTNALQKAAFSPNETAQLQVGYDQNGLVAEVADLSNGSDYSNNLQDFIYNVYYGQQINRFNYQLGAGYMTDIRGLSSDVGSAYTPSASTASSTATILGKRNGLYDVNGQVGYGSYAVIGEFLRTTTGATVIASNQNTGLMSAWVLGATYSPNLMGKPTAFALSYSKTNHMGAIPMYLSGSSTPSVITTMGFENTWIASVSREVANNFYVGPELAIAKAYNTHNTWTGTIDLSLYF